MCFNERLGKNEATLGREEVHGVVHLRQSIYV